MNTVSKAVLTTLAGGVLAISLNTSATASQTPTKTLPGLQLALSVAPGYRHTALCHYKCKKRLYSYYRHGRKYYRVRTRYSTKPVTCARARQRMRELRRYHGFTWCKHWRVGDITYRRY